MKISIAIRIAGLTCSVLGFISNASGQWNPALTPKMLPNGFFEASATISSTVTFQATADFRTWTNLGYFTATSETICPMIDLDATKFPKRFYRLESGGVRVIEAASLNITENRLEGVVDDPQFEDGMFDLSSTMLLTTEVRVETESRLRLRMFSAIPFSFGGNEILISLGKQGSVWFVNATLFQWADFNAYNGKFARRLPVLSGILTVKRFSAIVGADQENSGSFEFVFSAGTVRGTYRSGIVK